MTETKNSGQPKNDAGNTAATNVQANDAAATSTETLRDIEKKEVVKQSGSSAQGVDNRSATGATPDGQFDNASGEGTRGKDDGGPM